MPDEILSLSPTIQVCMVTRNKALGKAHDSRIESLTPARGVNTRKGRKANPIVPPVFAGIDCRLLWFYGKSSQKTP